ncbi:MAG: sugar-binding domain-containing protein [Prolixibacteraceae bacterium]
MNKKTQIIISFLILLVVISLLPVNAKNQPRFSTAGFYQLEGTGRQVFSMNIAWRFTKSDVANADSPSFDDSKWEVVSLPHGLEYLPLEASGGANYQGPAWYRKHFTPDNALKGKKLFLHFEAIMGKCQVWVNGKLATEHFGGYLPVIADVTNLLKWNEENTIAVKADNSNDPMYPPGKAQEMLDFTYFGGIYRDCWLVAHNQVHITDPNFENEVAGGGVFVAYEKVCEKSALVNLKTHIRNESSKDFAATVVYELKQTDGKVVNSTSEKLSLISGKASYSVRNLEVKSPNLWSPESPYLYQLNVYIRDKKGVVIDGFSKRIGIRSIEFKQKEGLWINGKPYGKIMGTNRHQDFAVLGNALPNTLQWRDAKKLRDAGMKVIRTHYVIDPAFMDACDELGLFALVETPGWQFWNKVPVFGERVYSDIRNMIRQNRDHASLFFWEPILNETSYPKDFAKKAADICKQEYPYPYSEAACDDGADGSEYFSLLLRPTKNLNPAKTYFTREWGDNADDWNAQNSDSRTARGWGEVPMLVQAKHYAEGYESTWTQSSQVVGGCFWHSFDHQRGYHPDPFYGGMTDAFRQPKMSYYMFMSQRDTVKRNFIAESGPMVYIAHEMTPFSPKDVTVYSNCDEVRLTVFKDGKQYTYKKDNQRIGMPSPIIVFNNVFDYMDCKRLARAKKQDDCYLLAEGLIHGKVVTSYKRYPAERPDHIRLRLDDDGVDLVANGSDVVSVIAEIVDKRGTVKRLNNSSIRFIIEGEGRIIGDASVEANLRIISWGSAPVLVQSTTKAGKIRITASILHEGAQRPIGGELVFNSIENTTPAIFSQKEVEMIGKQTILMIQQNMNKSDLEMENQKLRKELNELKIKEVEKQQTKFGVGIN